ncbi:MAG TPA: DUF1801 domain-containing protein [Thermoanaerobaculia bacterium]|nr:DUF1801 domain-containing protein [Thermoanaerobaculia bacterium]
MSDLATRPTDDSVETYLDQVADPERRADCRAVLELMREVTGEEPKLWGGSMVGFGTYHYRYDSGREGDWFLTGFAPRKQNLTLYVMAGFDRYDELMARLGKHKTGKSCLYVKRLADLDPDVLRELVASSVAHMRATYG